jgi:sporulation protein YlmC with PRC-barrel domain
MFLKSVIAGLAGSALLATVALAETPAATPGTTSAAPISSSSLHGDWRTSKVVGLNVYNDKNESIGSINDLLTDKNGSIKAAVLGVGGFLGVGAHLVAVPFDKIKFVSEPVPYTGMANSQNGTGSKGSASPPITTGAATGTTTSAPAASGTASKANPWAPDHAVYNATKDQLKAMPEFKYSAE